MARTYLKFKDFLIETLCDPQEAKSFLNGAILDYEEEGDTEAFLLALRYLTEAQGGVSKLSERAHLNKQNLYKILTGKTIPKLNTVLSIINALGFHLSPQPLLNSPSFRSPTLAT